MAYRDEVLADNPTAYWRLGEASGTTAVDESGNGHDGTYVNTSNLTLGVAGLIDDADTCVGFQGASSSADGEPCVALDGSVTSAFGPDEAVIEAWIDLEDVGASQHVIETGNDVDAFGFQVFGDAVHAHATIANTTYEVVAAIGAATRYHIVVRWDAVNGTLALSVNKALADLRDDLPTGSIAVASTPSGIGATHSKYSWATGSGYSIDDGSHRWGAAGRIDEVAFYNSLLSQARIDAHYDAGVDSGGGSGESVTLSYGQAAATGYALQVERTPQPRTLGLGAAPATGYGLQLVRAAQARQLAFGQATATGYPLSITEGAPGAQTRTLGFAQAAAVGYPLQPVPASGTRQLGYGVALATGWPLSVTVTPIARTLSFGAAAATGYGLQVASAAKDCTLGYAQAVAQGWPLSPAVTPRQITLDFGLAAAEGWPLQLVDTSRGVPVVSVSAVRSAFRGASRVRGPYVGASAMRARYRGTSVVRDPIT